MRKIILVLILCLVASCNGDNYMIFTKHYSGTPCVCDYTYHYGSTAFNFQDSCCRYDVGQIVKHYYK